MTRRKSVQLLVKKLSILSNHHHEKELVQEQCQKEPCREQPQTDILSSFPIEIILRILSFLSFQDLVKVQLTCRLWRRLTQDSSLWKSRFQDLNARCTDIYAHNPAKLAETCSLSWHKRYCQAITLTNWRMGAAQRVIKINKDDDSSRVLSVKLRDHLLVTLTENNVVKLYEYTSDNGFVFKLQWYFGDPSSTQNIVECVDVLPHIYILVIAQRGSRCMFFDINKGSNHDPIQVLKGGSHPWFIPDSIAVNQDYFAVAGRKPSAVFIWNWRKGIRLSSRAFDNQPHHVFLSGDNLITFSTDGLLHIFDIFDRAKHAAATHYMSPCSIPCVEYDSSLSVVIAPHASRRIHHYQWDPSIRQEQDNIKLAPSISVPLASPRKRFSTAFIHLLGIKTTTSDHQNLKLSSSKSANTSNSKKSSHKLTSIRRHSSYNDYGYACQMKTDQYIRQLSKTKQLEEEQICLPNFDQGPKLIHSIRTTPLGPAATEIVSVAIHQDRIATVNRQGDIALYALNGTTAARVSSALCMNDTYQTWMEDNSQHDREDDDLSDGYDFVRSRLAMGSMGLIYGGKGGSLWWLDFSCRAM